MAERDDAPLADEPQPGSVPNDIPSGIPDGAPEPTPLGPDDEPRPEGDGEPPRGGDAMPGIPPEGEEPTTAG